MPLGLGRGIAGNCKSETLVLVLVVFWGSWEEESEIEKCDTRVV